MCALPKLAAAAAIATGVAVSSGVAQAGGFGVREQSTSGLGASFAGIGASHDLSAIFWNPAGVSSASELAAEIDGALIVPDTHIRGTASFVPIVGPSVPLSFLGSDGGSFADFSLIPAVYAGTPLNDRWSIGFALNSPFGIITKPENDHWAGKFEARTSRLSTYNFNPVASYRAGANLVLGAGVQIEYADVALKSAFAGLGGLVGPNPNAVIEGSGRGFGYTLGALWRSTHGTDVGLGFRSSVEHTLRGETFVAGIGPIGKAKVSADLDTPAVATGSLRQRAGPRVTLLATVEWTNWSELDEVVVTARGDNPLLGAASGATFATLPFNWRDGWFFSGGAELEASDRLTLRTGAAYELSPIENATERLARVPDSDRIWLSLGGSYRVSARTSMDLAYSHVFFEDGPIDRVSAIPGAGEVHLLGQAEQALDIVAVSLKVKLGDPDHQ